MMDAANLIEQAAHLSVRSGDLWIEECRVAALAESFGTPLFVISEAELRRTYQQIRTAFASRWAEGTVEVLPSFKACPLIAVRRILSNLGAGCDVFGDAELEGALRGSCDPRIISVNGSIKSRDLIRRAIAIGARIVLDAPRELDLCIEEATHLQTVARVSLRTKPYLSDLDLHSDFNGRPIRDFAPLIKYGMPYNEVLETGHRALQSHVIQADGVHCHIGRHSTDPKLWRSLVRAYVALIADLRDRWNGWTPSVINLGGGLPEPRNFATHVVYHRQDDVPDIARYAEVITESLRHELATHKIGAAGLVLQIEPGRSLHAGSGLHLTTVVNVKTSTTRPAMRWIETDTSMFFLDSGVSSEGDPKFRFAVANRAGEPTMTIADIVGRSCGFERLLAQVPVPDIQPGDVVALFDTGAYHETETRNFNSMPRPGSVLVCGSKATMVKRPETIDDVYTRDIPGSITDASWTQ